MDRNFNVRPATAADISIIGAHRRAMFEEMGYSDDQALDAMDKKFKPWVAHKMARGDYRHWLAIDESGAIAAGAGLWVTESAAHPTDQSGRRVSLMNVYTERHSRHHGLANRLTRLILDWCKQNGIETVVLNASDAGRPIYDSLGFRATNEMRLQFKDAPLDQRMAR